LFIKTCIEKHCTRPLSHFDLIQIESYSKFYLNKIDNDLIFSRIDTYIGSVVFSKII